MSKVLKIMINGEQLADISVMDRGFQYGHGLFETMRVEKGVIPLLAQHLQRAKKDCERLAIPSPDLSQLEEDIKKLIIDTEKAVLKMIITRGIGGRGYALTQITDPQVVFILSPFPDYPDNYWVQGIEARICNLRLSQQPLLAGIKHLNRLEQVLARNEWNDSHITEGIMFDQNDDLIEATMSNIFIVKAGKVMTPELDRCGVEGVMRNTVLKLLKDKNINMEITRINQEQLFSANEIFLTNSLIGIWPVKKIGDNVYPVGDITRLLQNDLNKQLS
ncbi:MAG: aminodeoxychorismate lyase [Thioalkalispiraceae bacterium]|jgi:4-amino-4-deoxychorismate lyase